MDNDVDNQNRRIPSLVQFCQRAAAVNVDAIHGLGDLSYQLVKPILNRCTVEQLLRFEQLSPHLKTESAEIWKDLCFRKYMLTAQERYNQDDQPFEPDSWRGRYFELQVAEAKRIQEIGSRIRTQRLEADERKKEKEVKFTDRVPPAKRPRSSGWNAIVQPKTLFQKTRSEASKVQRTFNSRVIPPMPTAKGYRPVPSMSDLSFPTKPTSSTSETPKRVTVNTVTVHRPLPFPVQQPPAPTFREVVALNQPHIAQPSPSRPYMSTIKQFNKPPLPSPSRASSTTSTASSVPESPTHPPTKLYTSKKDPMALLFVPKRKVCPQRPG